MKCIKKTFYFGGEGGGDTEPLKSSVRFPLTARLVLGTGHIGRGRKLYVAGGCHRGWRGSGGMECLGDKDKCIVGKGEDFPQVSGILHLAAEQNSPLASTWLSGDREGHRGHVV